MEATSRWTLVTAVAPIAWGTTYFVTHRFLPADYPLYGATVRALPAGLLLLLVRRKLPAGSWWWRSLVLGTLNMGAFFALVYLAAETLPTSIASTVMATSPVMLMLFAWAALAERPRAAHLIGAAIGVAGVGLLVLAGPVAVDARGVLASTVMATSPVMLMLFAWAALAERPPATHLIGAAIGVAGVCLLVLAGSVAVDARGVLASIAAMVMSSFGYVLAKKWSTGIDVFSLTAWQLIAGGVVLIPVAIGVEGRPPALAGPAVAGFAYVTVVATALAFAAWFAGLKHLSAGTVGLIGLLNPVTGVLLGTLLAGEALSVRQSCGLLLVLLGVLLGQPALRAVLIRRPAVSRAPE